MSGCQRLWMFSLSYGDCFRSTLMSVSGIAHLLDFSGPSCRARVPCFDKKENRKNLRKNSRLLVEGRLRTPLLSYADGPGPHYTERNCLIFATSVVARGLSC